MRDWYRNAGPYLKYHKPADNWTVSGKAICGTDISRSGYYRSPPNKGLTNSFYCKKCRRIEDV